MSRTIARLTPDHLDALGDHGMRCSACVFWELDPVRRARLTDESRRSAEKRAWLDHVLREWGSCGRVVVVDDRPVGYVIYAPAAYVPGAATFPTAPVSSDAVLLTTAYVDPAYAGGGLGRMLVQAMARDLVGRGGFAAVEAFGDPRGRGRCVLSSDFLGSVGFTPHRPHPTCPRMRMDLRTALTWKDEVGSVLDRLRSLRPAPAPVPETRSPRA